MNYITDKGIDKTTVLYFATPKSDKVVIQENEIKEAKYLINYFKRRILFLSLSNVLKEIVMN